MSRVDDIINDVKAAAFDLGIGVVAKTCGMSHDALARLIGDDPPMQIANLSKLDAFVSRRRSEKALGGPFAESAEAQSG